VHPFGLGDKDQTVTMNLSSGGSLIGSMMRDFHEGKQIQVQVRSGDAVLRDLGLSPPHVIKIDVEGYEPSVFAGLAETITKHRPIMAFEHIYLSDEQIKELVPKGYLLYLIQNDGSIQTDLSMRRNGIDAMLVPAEKVERIGLEPSHDLNKKGITA
jgi:hypothetical protein